MRVSLNEAPLKMFESTHRVGQFLLVAIITWPVVTVGHSSLRRESLWFSCDQAACDGEQVIFCGNVHGASHSVDDLPFSKLSCQITYRDTLESRVLRPLTETKLGRVHHFTVVLIFLMRPLSFFS